MIRISLLIAIVLKFQGTMCDVSLSPETWPQGEIDRLERMTLNRIERPKPLAVSNGKGVIAGTTEPLAVHSGMDALRKGGNAMDACLATALAGTKQVSLHVIYDNDLWWPEQVMCFHIEYKITITGKGFSDSEEYPPPPPPAA